MRQRLMSRAPIAIAMTIMILGAAHSSSGNGVPIQNENSKIQILVVQSAGQSDYDVIEVRGLARFKTFNTFKRVPEPRCLRLATRRR
jgi:hypothetical protein